MKYNRFIFCIIIVYSLMTGAMVSAQESNHSLGLQVGFAEPVFRLNAPESINENKSKLDKTVLNGLKAGFIYDATLIHGFGYAMGANYTFGIQQSRWQDYGYDADGNANVLTPAYEYRTKTIYHQAEVFVDWQYKFEIAKETYLLLYTGPTIQCIIDIKSGDDYRLTEDGIFRRQTLNHPIPDRPNTTVDSYAGQIAGRVRRLNVTWGIGAGFQYKRYFVRGGYDFGLINPYNQQAFSDYGYSDDRLTRGRLDQWSIRVGYFFLQSKK